MPFKLRLPAATLLFILLFRVVSACAQDQSDTYVLLPNQQTRITSLPSAVADSTSDSAVLTASVEMIVVEPDVCCGRNSALADQVPAAKTLKELGERLRGKHVLDTGSSILVTDQYWSGASVNAEDIVGSLLAKRPLLMDWNSHLYVLDGAVFDEYRYSSGRVAHVIRKLLLVDTRFSDNRRQVVFDRQKDDWGKVSGLLALAITR